MGIVKDLVREIDKVVLPKHQYTRNQLNHGPPEIKPQPIGFNGAQQIDFVPYETGSAYTLSDDDVRRDSPTLQTPNTPTNTQHFAFNSAMRDTFAQRTPPRTHDKNDMNSNQIIPDKTKIQPTMAPIGIDKAKKTAMGSPRLLRKSIKVKVIKKNNNQTPAVSEVAGNDANDIYSSKRNKNPPAVLDAYDSRSIQSIQSFESTDSRDVHAPRRDSFGRGRPQLRQEHLAYDSNEDLEQIQRDNPQAQKRIIRVLAKRSATTPGAKGNVPQNGHKKDQGGIGIMGGNSININGGEGNACGCQPAYGAHRCLTPPSYSDALLDEHVALASTHNGSAVKMKVRRASKSHTVPKSVIKTPKPRLTWNESTYIYPTFGGLGDIQGLDSYKDFSTMEVYDRRPFPCTYTSALSAEDVDNIKEEVGELHRELFGFYPEY